MPAPHSGHRETDRSVRSDQPATRRHDDPHRAISEHAEWLDSLLNDVAGIVWECKFPEYQFSFVGAYAEKLLGYPIERWLNDPNFWPSVIHPDDRERSLAFCLEETVQGRDHEFDHRVIAADGRVLWLRDIVRIVKDEAGNPTKLRGILLDITEQKRAEEALRSSEEQLRTLAENVNAVVWIRTGDADQHLYVSPRYEEIWGRPLETLRENPDAFIDTIHPDDRDVVSAMLQKLREGRPAEEFDAEYRIERADGEVRWIRDRGFSILDADGRVLRQAGLAEDITDSREAQDKLKASEQRYRNLVKELDRAQRIGKMGSWEVDLESGEVTTSSELRRIIGVDPREMNWDVRSLIDRFIHPDDRPDILRLVAESQRSEAAVETPYEFRICRPDGSERVLRVESQLLHRNDQPTRLVGTLQDITEETEAARALKDSEEKFRVLTEQSPAVVFIARRDRLLYANPSFYQSLGYAPEELAKIRFLDIIHPDQRDTIRQRHWSRLEGETVPKRFDVQFMTKSGDERWFDVSAETIDFEGDPAGLATCVDITERREAEQRLRDMEEQLAHVSRLSTMGEMVAGIAHDVKQPLSAIANFATACKMALTRHRDGLNHPSTIDDLDTWLDDINRQANRCSDIIRQLKNFVGTGKSERVPVDINRVAHDSIALVQGDLRRASLSIDCRLPSEGYRVDANEVQLQQVLVNLLRNACDATRDTDQPRVALEVTHQGNDVVLRVTDNGHGIAAEHLPKLFEPFFTTKADGMGMGLAISRSIIEAHDGSLAIDTRTPHATTLVVTLPRGTNG